MNEDDYYDGGDFTRSYYETEEITLGDYPCPWCQEVPELEEQAGTGLVAVCCPACGCHGGWAESDNQARDDWKTFYKAMFAWRTRK